MNCVVEDSKITNDFKALTVGRVFYINCEGDFGSQFDAPKAAFKLDDKSKYAIKLLNVTFSNPNKAQLEVTSYTTGNISIPELTLTDGTNEIKLGKVDFTIESIVQDASQEAYGPIAPLGIPIPLEYWLSAIIFIVLVISTLSRKYYLFRQRQKMMTELSVHDSALHPVVEFYAKTRKLKKESPVFFGKNVEDDEFQKCLNEIDHMWKLFLIRTFRVPAFEWRDKLILSSIKKYYPKVYKGLHKDIEKNMIEIDRAKKSKIGLKDTDIILILNLTRATIEKIDKLIGRKESHENSPFA